MGSVSPQLQTLTYCDTIWVCDFRLSDAGVVALCRSLPACESVDLEGSRSITDASIRAIVEAWPELWGLRVKGARFTDEGILLLRDLPRLSDLEFVDVPGVTAKGARVVAQLPHLERLVAPADWFNDEFDEIVNRRGLIIGLSDSPAK